jgi:hypothetical protein
MSEPTKRRCAELIRLCSGLDFFPKDAVVRDRLIDTLQRLTVSDDHATRVIDRWLERERRAPLVSDLVALAAEVNPTVNRVVLLNYGCPECEGTGFQIVSKGVLGITGVAPCPNRCAVPSGEPRSDTMSRRAQNNWYREQEDAVPARRAALNERRILPPRAADRIIATLQRKNRGG